MKIGPYHLRRDGCWKEVPQLVGTGKPGEVIPLSDPRVRCVLRLLFEWPWQKKDPMLRR